MKKVLHFFSSRPEEKPGEKTPSYGPKEPTLQPRSPRPQGGQQTRPQGGQPTITRTQPTAAAQDKQAPDAVKPSIPTGYAELVAFFNDTVAQRKSPYNALVKAADRLKDFIPNDVSRLQAALSICGDQWSPEALSLAISTHLSDIEQAKKKAKSSINATAAERAVKLRGEMQQFKEKNAQLQSEIQALNEKLGKLEAALNANNSALASLNSEIQIAEANAGSSAFLDQAAENVKNDLLARKVLLGLP